MTYQTTPTTRIYFTSEELDVLDDVTEYYAVSDMGGGARATKDDRATLRNIDRKIGSARRRLALDEGIEGSART